ncbi:MAG TPA: restriction endonuclease subunit S [Casimicrobiaceae bacterium]|nr:restriction endonuclease subunit S [Casimicrobiaceae bacterium]
MAHQYTDSGVPVLRGVNVNRGRFHDDDFVFIDDETADRLDKFQSFPGDVLLVHKGTLGQIGLMPTTRKYPRYIMGNSMMRVRCDPAILVPEYLYYWLSSADGQHYLYSRVSQVGVPQIQRPLSTLRQAVLPVPPVAEQRAITHILGTLDDKIELNRRMNETLESMARALFKSWFVDFAPVRAKAEGRDPGLARPLADLFPARLVASDLGEIPNGWAMAPLGDYFDAVKGVSYKGDGLADSGMPLHNLNSVYEGGGYKYEGIKYYTGEYRDRHLVRPGDVIVANTEQGHDRLLIGYAALVPALFGDRGIASHHIYRLRAKPGSALTEAFLCHLLNSPRMHDFVSGYANGTTVNMLPIDGVQQPLIACPPSPLVAAFTTLALNMERRREEMISESRALAALRDGLLPRLISGKVRVNVARDIVERAPV